MDPLLTEKEVQANPDTTTLETTIASEQASFKEKDAGGKYKQVKPEVDGDVVKEVHEYVCSDGKTGYQVIVKANVKGKEMVKSFGEGPESEARSHDWVEVVEEDL